jgi:hypothetical protein
MSNGQGLTVGICRAQQDNSGCSSRFLRLLPRGKMKRERLSCLSTENRESWRKRTQGFPAHLRQELKLTSAWLLYPFISLSLSFTCARLTWVERTVVSTVAQIH